MAQIAPTTTTAPTKSEAGLRTPLEVTSAKDTGYSAYETRSGTHFKMRSEDTGIAATFITPDFMRDPSSAAAHGSFDRPAESGQPPRAHENLPGSALRRNLPARDRATRAMAPARTGLRFVAGSVRATRCADWPP